MKKNKIIRRFMECTITRYVFLLVLCVICFFDTLRGDFVFDDTVAVVKNKDVTSPDVTLQQIFNHDFWGYNMTDSTSHKSYRPLTILMFRHETNLLGMSSYAMKFINLIIHCINTCLLLKFYTRLTSKREISFIGAVLFAIHPIHTEAVCGIVGRAELMFCFCYLLCLILFSSIEIAKQSNLALFPTYVAVVSLSIIGILFKENAITIMPACVAYDVIVRTNLLQNLESRFRVKRVVFLRCGILLLITSLLLTARLYVQNFESPKFKPMDNPIAINESRMTQILSQSFLYVLNIWILLCPEWLSFDWALGCVNLIETYMDYRILAILILYLLMYLLIFRCSRLILLSVALIVVPFLPASGLINVGFVIAERILYVPSIGFCLLVAIGFSVLVDRVYKLKYLYYIFIFLVMILLILRTRQRANEWTSEEKLFSSALHVCPNNAKVYYNIARLATDQKETKKAFVFYHKAISLYPEYESALMNLGNLYREVGDYDTAELYLKKSISLLEDFPAAWMNLGIVQASKKQFEEALKSYKKALTYRRKYPTCLYNLGNLYLDMKNYSMAMKYWQESVAINPTLGKAWANILAFLDNRGLLEDALRISERALNYVPNETSILFIRANVQGKLKNYIESEQLFNKVIATNPDNAASYANLGVLYHRWGKYDLAIRSYENALKIDKNLKSAKDNLSKLLLKQNLS